MNYKPFTAAKLSSAMPVAAELHARIESLTAELAIEKKRSAELKQRLTERTDLLDEERRDFMRKRAWARRWKAAAKTLYDVVSAARVALFAPTNQAASNIPLLSGQSFCQGCGHVVTEPHKWKQCAEALWNDYECENGNRCEIESALSDVHEALKVVLAQRDAALDYIDHRDTCARCDGFLMGPQPEDYAAHCEFCHPDEFESEKWHEEYQRLRKLVDDAMAQREHERRPIAEVQKVSTEQNP